MPPETRPARQRLAGCRAPGVELVGLVRCGDGPHGRQRHGGADGRRRHEGQILPDADGRLPQKAGNSLRALQRLFPCLNGPGHHLHARRVHGHRSVHVQRRQCLPELSPLRVQRLPLLGLPGRVSGGIFVPLQIVDLAAELCNLLRELRPPGIAGLLFIVADVLLGRVQQHRQGRSCGLRDAGRAIVEPLPEAPVPLLVGPLPRSVELVLQRLPPVLVRLSLLLRVRGHVPHAVLPVQRGKLPLDPVRDLS